MQQYTVISKNPQPRLRNHIQLHLSLTPMKSVEEEWPQRTIPYTTELDSKISYSVSFVRIRGVEETRVWWQLLWLVVIGDTRPHASQNELYHQ
jgi:hypothetical protein